jgi:hypothetical protein
MLVAYDKIKKRIVNAEEAAKDERSRYRYRCSLCGEDVFLAVSISNKKVPHFRHYKDNRDTECEAYFKSHGYNENINTNIFERKYDRISLYFDSYTKSFYAGLCFKENEIINYQNNNSELQFRHKQEENPFKSIEINRNTFIPDNQERFLLDIFSNKYIISDTLHIIDKEFDIFKFKSPSVFKINLGHNNFRAKFITTSVIYTNTFYFFVFPKKYSSSFSIKFPKEIVKDYYNFETMNEEFLGYVLFITMKTSYIKNILTSWGYQLEDSESLTCLWPPSSLLEDVLIIKSDYAYIWSSFELKPFINTNIEYDDIIKINNNISKISLSPITKIFYDNSELILEKQTSYKINYDTIDMSIEMAKEYQIKDEFKSFLFNSFGVTPLKKQNSILLTPRSEIKQYSSGYLIKKIIPTKPFILRGKLLINDIIKHYKTTEEFRWEDFDYINISDTILEYLDSCAKSGKINSAVKRFILDGRI